MRSKTSKHWKLDTAHWILFIAHCSLFIILALAGCGAQAPTLPTPTPTSSPLSPLPTPTLLPESQPMIITLGLWLPEELDPYGEGPAADVLAQQLTEFSHAHPDLQVEVTVKKAYGRGGLLDFLRTARAAAPSVLPDLIVLDAADLETAAGSGLVQPLDPLLAPAEMTDRFPFAAELGTVGDQTLGLVVAADMQHMAYRPALLDSPPVSWMHVISPPVSFLFPAGGRDRQINDATLIQYLACGGQLTNPEGRPWLDEEVMVSVLGFYSDCTSIGPISPTYHTPAISPTVVLNITDADQAWERFKAGEGEMTMVRASRYWLEADETIAAASIPTRDGRPFSIARGWVVAMVANDPARQSLATLLLEWLVSPDHSAQWTQTAGFLPGTRGALRLWDISDADRAVLRNTMEAAVVAPPPEAMATTGRAMQEALEALLRRRVSPEDAAAAAGDILGQ
ncbi:MAG TPA: extracellular solute-binding protein [Thermoflexia bacterium]|nr:extracellular solute-binding protein [Thermoflexia bacterium]